MQLLKKSCLLVLGLAMLVLARPMSVLAATADPVLEWIGIMNDTVLAGGTNPLVTSRVVALCRLLSSMPSTASTVGFNQFM